MSKRDIRNYMPQGGRVVKEDGTTVNWGDGINEDGTQRVTLTGSYVGLSTDAKPTIENPIQGVTYSFFEADTGDAYVFCNGEWMVI